MQPDGERIHSAARQAAIITALFCGMVQCISATFVVRRFDSPNFASRIGRNLAERGEYAGGEWWRLKGPDAPPGEIELRAFHLPGEPLYLAAAFRWLPSGIHRYLHLPVTTALVSSMAFVCALLWGLHAGVLAGLFASIQPFVVMHGPVWDDTFLGAALEWTILAIACGAGIRGEIRRTTLLLVGVLAAWAATTRSQSQAVLALLATGMLLWPTFRSNRSIAVVMLAGLTIGIGAWGLRNRVTLGEFFIGSTHDGITLWESNYPHAIEALLSRGQVERLNSEKMTGEFMATREMSELEANRYFKSLAIRRIASEPLETAKAASVKSLIAITGIRPEEPILGLRNLAALAGNAMLLTFAGYGILTIIRQRPAAESERASERRRSGQVTALYAGLTAAATIGLTWIGPVGMRYRIGFDALLWMAGGVALADLQRRLALKNEWLGSPNQEFSPCNSPSFVSRSA